MNKDYKNKLRTERGKRLEKVITDLDITPTIIAESIDLDKGNVSKMIHGIRDIHEKVLDYLCQKYDINRYYILMGEEPIRNNNTPNTPDTKLVETLVNENIKLSDGLISNLAKKEIELTECKNRIKQLERALNECGIKIPDARPG